MDLSTSIPPPVDLPTAEDAADADADADAAFVRAVLAAWEALAFRACCCPAATWVMTLRAGLALAIREMRDELALDRLAFCFARSLDVSLARVIEKGALGFRTDRPPIVHTTGSEQSRILS